MRDLIAAEWIKLRSVQSTWWALMCAASTSLGIAAVFSHVTASNAAHAAQPPIDPLGASFSGFALAQLATATLGVLAISSEYGTGLIRTTFAAAPRRTAVLAAKAVVVGLVCLVAGELIAFASFVTAQLLLRPAHLDVPLTDPGALWRTAGTGLYLVVVALIGLGFGAVIRHTAGALAAVFALLFLISQVVFALPEPWRRVAGYMPPVAAEQIGSLYPNPHLPGWPVALLALLAWAVATVVAGTATATRTDA